ncbi:MAG: major facilitator superfamily 1 [Frankiales bacterium]|nr:major facilitator superfamily 1 [Frankiales bacterium]
MQNDLRTRWSVLAAFVVVTSANQMLWLTYAPITTTSAEHYGVGEGAIGALSAVFPLLYVVLAIPAGFALDRHFRGSLQLGAGLTALGGLVRLVDDSFAAALVGSLVVAVAQPLVTNSVAKVATAYAREQDRPLGIAVGSAGLFAGFLLAFGTGIALGDDLPLLLAVQAAYALLGAVALGLALRAAPAGAAEAVASGRDALRAVWGDPVVRATTTLVVVGFGVFVGLTTWLQVLLEPDGVDADETGLLLIAMVVAGVVGSAVLPPLVARRGSQQGVLGAALLATVLGSLALVVVRGLVATGLVLAVLGLALLTTLPVVLELTERRAGAASGTAAALLWMAGNAGGLVVTVLLVPLLDHRGLAFGLLAVVAALGLPAVRRVRDDRMAA